MAGNSQAVKTVFIAGSGMFAIVLAQAVRRPGTFGKGQVYRQVWAIGVLTLLLAAAADFAPDLIVPFSIAVVVAFAIKNPGALGHVLTGQASAPASASTGGATSTHTPKGIGGKY